MGHHDYQCSRPPCQTVICLGMNYSSCLQPCMLKGCMNLRRGAGVLLAKPPSNLLGRVCVRGALQSLCCPLQVSVAVGTASAHSGGGTRTGMKEIGFWPPEPLDPHCPWSLFRPTLLRRGQSSQPGASRHPTETWRENELDPGDTHTSCVLHKGI